jgi:hypothetical protein
MSAEQSQNPYAAPRAKVDDAASVPAATTGPRGIGGWLILPLLGLIFTPFRIGLQMVRDVLPVLKPETWHALTTPGTASYHPLWAPLIVFEVGANCVLIAFSVALLWLFFRKSRRVPMLMVVWLLANTGGQIVDLLLAQQIPAVAALPDNDGIKELSRSVVGLLIWVPYFLVSKRVKNTFVV